MASGKRPPHFVGHDRDGEDPGNNSKRRQGDSVPTQIGACGDNDTIRGDNKLVEKIFGPMIRRVVGEVVTTALERRRHRWTSGQRWKTLQLRFKESPGETYTGVEVKAKNGASLEVALYQCDAAAGVVDRIVTEGPLSSTEIELCLLQGSLGSNGREDWSSQEFRDSILNQTRKGGQLLTGTLFLRLTNGVGTVEDLFVHDISTWAKTQHFRLGAKVATTTPETENIREGISQPFRVKDCRGRGYQKPDIPSLNDEIWRLEGIAKDGKTHQLLQSKGINTVGAFLHRLNTDLNKLKQDLRMGRFREKTWKKLVDHAKKAYAKQDARQACLPTAPLHSEPQHLVQAVQGLPQHEPPPAAPQGLSELLDVGADIDFNLLAEILNPSSAREGHGSCESSCPNSGVYISNRGNGTTIWSQIRSALKATRTRLHRF